MDYSKLLTNRLTFKEILWSCIDLIFSSQPNLVMSSGIHSPPHQNCHHQIIFAKFNLKVYYPPPYEREVWHFEKANTDHIKRTICGFLWERSFANLDRNGRVYLIKQLKIYFQISYFMKIDRDPPWINSQVIFSFHVTITLTKEWPSWAKLEIQS